MEKYTWLKPRISKNARKFTALFGSSAETSGVKTEDERVDSDDLTDMVAVAAKLQGAVSLFLVQDTSHLHLFYSPRC